MKKVLSIVLSIAMVLCMMPAMAFAGTSAAYSDIEGAACEASVELLSELGVVNGYSDGTYKPENEVTRAEMAKLIVAALGLDPQAGTSSFIDMGAAEWAIPYVGYAQSLGIINGYGGGKFGPNDNVTYDQAITMIVRALGYTTACNEMQGTWPAVFVQKANELGILKDVNKFGSNPSNRGDIAIMLANALDVQMVYADGEGRTIGKTDADGTTAVTMYSSLVKEAGSSYLTITPTMVDNATKNIASYLGAAGKVVVNEDGDPISVSDIKTTFLKGKFEDGDFNTFTVDGKDYTLDSGSTSIAKKLDKDGKGEKTSSIPFFVNGATSGSAISVSGGAVTWNITTGSATYILAATLSGKTITGVYSVQQWNGQKHQMVSESDILQIEKNHKLLGKEFKETDDGDIDTNKFVLAGVDSLAQIAEDNVVYVYSAGDKITKIEVGTEKVTGEVTKASLGNTDPADDYVTIDGTKYKIAATHDSITDLAAGNEVEVYLDYAGKVYKAEYEAGANGEYAYVVNQTAYKTEMGATTKVKLLNAAGANIYAVDNDDVTESDYNAAVTLGAVVKFRLNSNNEIKYVTSAAVTSRTGIKITAKGYLDGHAIKDSAVILAGSTTGTPLKFNPSTDEDDYSVLTKEKVLDKTMSYVEYITNDKDEIVYLMVSQNSTSDDIFGVIGSTWSIKDGTGADYYNGASLVEDIEVDKVTTTGALSGIRPNLYKINVNADESVEFVATAPSITVDPTTSAPALSGNHFTTSDSSISVDFSSDVVVYVYDLSDDKYEIGIKSDVIDTKNANIYLYKTAKSDDDDYGLVTYVIIVRP